MNAIIETKGLTQVYGELKALNNLNLVVPEGSVFALLGPNGAGKTTALKAMMNLLAPTEGEVRVLGVDATRLGPEQFQQIGYISENQDLPLWMTVRQFMDYCAPLYPSWDEAFCQQLLWDFQLPAKRKLKHLSRGMRMKAALAASLAYHPKLLVLDEPFSGLDPLSRDELIAGMIAVSERDKWTVLISSHDIQEVERMVDWVGILMDGMLRVCEPIAKLQERFRRVQVSLGAVWQSSEFPPLVASAEWLDYQSSGHAVSFVETNHTEGSEGEIRAVLPDSGEIEFSPLSLREIFVALNLKKPTKA